MEEEKRKVYIVVAILALVGVLFSCLAGALGGSLAGLLVARRQAEAAAERVLQSWATSRVPEPVPVPEGPVQVPPRGGMMPRVQGASIVEIVPGTPADEAGLKVGDVITAIDQTQINPRHLLLDVVREYKPGDRVTIHFWRADREESVQVKLGESPDVPGKAYLGIKYQMLVGPGLQGPED